MRQEPEVLKAHLESLKWQELPDGVEVEYVFVHDGDEEQRDIIRQINPIAIIASGDRRPDQVYNVSGITHEWSIADFDHVAKNKQKLLDYAVQRDFRAKWEDFNDYTHVFLVDSDLILDRTTLKSLLSCEVEAVSAVFYTEWMNGSGRPEPQVWLQHPYGHEGLGKTEAEHLRTLSQRGFTRVIGGGAAFLLDIRAIEAGAAYHPRLEGLPQHNMWQGEDRSFAIRLQKMHINQYADAWPDIYHAYHVAQRTSKALEEAKATLEAPRQRRASYGDLVALKLIPMEDAELQNGLFPGTQLVRGRLGQLKLAPEIEHFALTHEVGQKAMIDVSFPYWFELEFYRNQTKMIEVELVDAKPYGFAPCLAEYMFRSLE